GIGEFANRGGLVDVWPPGAGEPLRIELFGDELESLRGFDPMTQGSRRRLERATLLPASEFLPADGFEALRMRAPGGSRISEELAADLARLEQGDLGEAAETWAALLTATPAAAHIPSGSHLVLTDSDELAAIATDLDSRIGELLDEAGRPTGAVAELAEPPPEGGIGLAHGSLSCGFAHGPSKLLVLTDRELFGAIRVRRLTSAKRVVTRDLIGK